MISESNPSPYPLYEPTDQACPRSIQELFDRALEDDPAKRLSAAEASRMLRKIVEE